MRTNQAVSKHPYTRAAALEAIRAHSLVPDCKHLWHALVEGRKQIVDTFFELDRCYMVLVEAPAREPLHANARDVLERVIVTGEAQKVVAYERKVAVSTVAMRGRLALQLLGLHCSASRAPASLIMLGRAATTSYDLPQGQFTEFGLEAARFLVVSAERPDRWLSPLSTAERAVVALLVEGKTYAQISTIRSSSIRTVANQAAEAFRRLRVSGRIELVVALCAVKTSLRPGLRFPPDRASSHEHESDRLLHSTIPSGERASQGTNGSNTVASGSAATAA